MRMCPVELQKHFLIWLPTSMFCKDAMAVFVHNILPLAFSTGNVNGTGC